MPRGVPQKEKTCPLCGDTFVPKAPAQIFCKKTHYVPCPICGSPVVWNSTSKNIPGCSKICRDRLRKVHNISKWGVDHPMKLESVRNRQTDTMVEKYGVKYAMQSDVINKKTDRKSEECPSVLNFTQSADEIRKYVKDNLLSSSNRKSRVQCLKDTLQRRGIKFLEHITLDDYIFDICVPSSRTVICIDDSVSCNCIITNECPEGVRRDHLYTMSTTANSNGYSCIHVFDWDSLDRVVDIISRAHNVIYARDCSATTLESTTLARDFLRKNHLQGNTRGTALYTALLYRGDIVQIMSFGKPRYNSKYEYELLRMCSKKDVRVVGGASKLFLYSVSSSNISSMISYCDISKFSGNVYPNMGMRFKGVTDPNIVWSKGDKKITANLLRQRGFDQLFHTKYGKGTNNNLLMIKNGWLPVYDCGQKLFSYSY